MIQVSTSNLQEVFIAVLEMDDDKLVNEEGGVEPSFFHV